MIHRWKNKKSEKGFTLTELLITMAIMGLVMSAVAAIFFFSGRAQNSVQAATDTNFSSNKIIKTLSSDIRKAVNIDFYPGATDGFRLQLQDGSCAAWGVASDDNGVKNLYAKHSDTTIGNPSNDWILVSKNIRTEESTLAFSAKSSSGLVSTFGVGYDFAHGVGAGNQSLKGEFYTRNAQQTSATSCFE